ncbi:MAG: hypothetical protein NUV56_03375 [Candidatus Uhrbacteria bacterium]|nr:hypothetical protein [Candidatus Uhrbacteria bacterium]
MQNPVSRPTSWFTSPYVLVGVGVVTLAIIATASTFLPGSEPTATSTRTISMADDAAFGSLSSIAASRELTNATSGAGGGSGPSSVSSDSTLDSRSILVEPYPSTRYEYVYGGTVNLQNTAGLVYRKDASIALPSSITSAITSTDLGIIDLARIGNATLTYMTMTNDDYTLTVDPASGSMYLNVTSSDVQAETTPFTINDVPHESDIVSIAKNFIDNLGVDRAGYGDAMIDTAAMAILLSTPDGGFASEYLNVTWPLTIDNTPVFNSDGSGRGITVTVDLRNRKVVSLNMNVVTTVSSSSYALTTDGVAFMDIVKRGGMWGWQPETADNVITVTLGDPTNVLMSHSRYNDSTGQYEELFVPALSFPIIEASDDSTMYQSAIVIPLVQEILDGAASDIIYRVMEDAVLE